MGENTKIEWADYIDPAATGRLLGAYKSAAKKTGVSLEEWMSRRLAGEKRCFRCKTWKQGNEFSVDPSRAGGRSSTCKPCTSLAATASRYGITLPALVEMKDGQGGICPICNRPQSLVVDHHHGTGAVRGLLCNRCNVGLGQFEDDPELMKRATAYLEGRLLDGVEHNGMPGGAR